MSNATIVANAFGEGADLYEILGIPRSSSSSSLTAAQLRKAYYRKSLSCHPDKVPGKEAEFHALTVAYTILKNEESRAIYYDTGELIDLDDENGIGCSTSTTTTSSFDDLKHYFSSIFGTVTTSKIDAFGEQYKCSDEEEQDVLRCYQLYQGHVGKMLQSVMLSTEQDAEQRWMEDYIQPAIQCGRVKDYTKQYRTTLKQCLAKAKKQVTSQKQKKKTTTTLVEDDDDDDDDATESDDVDDDDLEGNRKNTTSMTRAEWEAQQAEVLKNKIQNKARTPSSSGGGGGGKNKNNISTSLEQQLTTRMANRQQGMDSFLNGLELKYGQKQGGPKKRAKQEEKDDPLDDEEFERIQASMMKKKINNKTTATTAARKKSKK